MTQNSNEKKAARERAKAQGIKYTEALRLERAEKQMVFHNKYHLEHQMSHCLDECVAAFVTLSK